MTSVCCVRMVSASSAEDGALTVMAPEPLCWPWFPPRNLPRQALLIG